MRNCGRFILYIKHYQQQKSQHHAGFLLYLKLLLYVVEMVGVEPAMHAAALWL
jgi:hypothetical protein